MLKLEKSQKEAVADDDEVPAKNAHTLSPSRLLFHKYIIIIHLYDVFSLLYKREASAIY